MTSRTIQDVTERVRDDVSHVARTETVIAVTRTLGTTLSSWTTAHFPLHRIAAQQHGSSQVAVSLWHRRMFHTICTIVLGQEAAGLNVPEWCNSSRDPPSMISWQNCWLNVADEDHVCDVQWAHVRGGSSLYCPCASSAMGL